MRRPLGKEKIIKAAVKLFTKNGYHRTSTSDIASAANVSKGLMYNYFDSKEALLLAIMEHASKDMFAVAETMDQPHSYIDTLRAFIDEFGRSLKKNKKFFAFQLSLITQPDLRAIIDAHLQNRVQHLLSASRAMFEKTNMQNPDMIARRFIAELDGTAFQYLVVFKHYPLDDMLEQMFNNYKEISL